MCLQDNQRNCCYVELVWLELYPTKLFNFLLELGTPEFITTDLKSQSERHDQILPKKGFDSIAVKGNPNAQNSLGVINPECNNFPFCFFR